MRERTGGHKSRAYTEVLKAVCLRHSDGYHGKLMEVTTAGGDLHF